MATLQLEFNIQCFYLVIKKPLLLCPGALLCSIVWHKISGIMSGSTHPYCVCGISFRIMVFRRKLQRQQCIIEVISDKGYNVAIYILRKIWSSDSLCVQCNSLPQQTTNSFHVWATTLSKRYEYFESSASKRIAQTGTKPRGCLVSIAQINLNVLKLNVSQEKCRIIFKLIKHEHVSVVLRKIFQCLPHPTAHTRTCQKLKYFRRQ